MSIQLSDAHKHYVNLTTKHIEQNKLKGNKMQFEGSLKAELETLKSKLREQMRVSFHEDLDSFLDSWPDESLGFTDIDFRSRASWIYHQDVLPFIHASQNKAVMLDEKEYRSIVEAKELYETINRSKQAGNSI